MFSFSRFWNQVRVCLWVGLGFLGRARFEKILFLYFNEGGLNKVKKYEIRIPSSEDGFSDS